MSSSRSSTTPRVTGVALALALLSSVPGSVSALDCMFQEFELAKVELIEPLPGDPAEPIALIEALELKLPTQIQVFGTSVSCWGREPPPWLSARLCEAVFEPVQR